MYAIRSYYACGPSTWRGLRQGGYVVNADSTENTRLIRLRFSCVDDREHEYAVRPKATADEIV